MATKKKVEKKPEPQKISPDLISEVLCGKWGEDGKVRNSKLRDAGYNPSLVTKKINELRKVFEANVEMFIGLGNYIDCMKYFYPHE